MKNGGCLSPSIYHDEKVKPGVNTGLYLYSENLPATLGKIHENGGLVVTNGKLGGPHSSARFADPDGNTFKLTQQVNPPKDVQCKTLVQEISFKLKPSQVYEVFTNSKRHSEVSGMQDTCNTAVRGLNTLFNNGKFGAGMTGRTLEAPIENKRVVLRLRSWDWPVGHFATQIVEIKETKEGCDVKLTLEDLPAAHYDKTNDGIYVCYWNKMGDGVKKEIKGWKP